MPKPTKTYYRIREVAAMLDIPDYTLRYWEDEFPMFNPDRTPSGQRRFSPADIDMAMTIKELLYEKRMKIEGAIEYLSKTYRKQPPRRLRKCESAEAAITLLSEVKDTLTDAHSIAKLQSVINYLGQ